MNIGNAEVWIGTFFLSLDTNISRLRPTITPSSSQMSFISLVRSSTSFLWLAKSWGTLSVVGGKPGTAEANPLPFRVYLRRDGAVVHNPLYQNPVYDISFSVVLAMARPGDQLIIDPVEDEDYKAKRILRLID